MGLPLYPLRPMLEVLKARPLELNRGCRLCGLQSGAMSPCLPAEGEAGGVLLVGQAPGQTEDAVGRPFAGKSGKHLRQLVAKYWHGPVALDNACRCFPLKASTSGDNRPTDKQVASCRGYLHRTIREARPTKIIALGEVAIESLTGTGFPPFSCRRGYAWMHFDGRDVPIYLMMHPAAALRNRFVAQWFEQDLKWALTTDPPFAAQWDAEIEVVDSWWAADEAVAACRSAGWFAFDTETTGRWHHPEWQILALGATPAGSQTTYVWDWDALRAAPTVAPIKKLLADPKVGKAGANIKFDINVVAHVLGVEVRGIRSDVQLQRHLIDPDAEVNLATMSALVGMGGIKDESLDVLRRLQERLAGAQERFQSRQLSFGERVDGTVFHEDSPCAHDPVLAQRILAIPKDQFGEQDSYAILPCEVLVRRVARDAHATMLLAELVPEEMAKVEGPALVKTWSKTLQPSPNVFGRMERCGIAADSEAFEALRVHFGRKITEARARMAVYGKFNPGSPNDLRDLLFRRLGLQSDARTDTGLLSTDKDVLKRLRGQHPVIDDIIEFRKFAKYLSNYVDVPLSLIRPDGRVHGEVNIDGARSGRLSITKPALQTVPNAKKSDDARLIRRCYVASPGNVLLEADLSQAELRVAAERAVDPLMIDIFRHKVDYHQRTAELISQIAWGIPPSAVTEGHRDMAKVTNFAVLYGREEYGLAYALDCDVEQARALIEAIFGKFTRLAEWIHEVVDFARREGRHFVWWEGAPSRHRYLWRIADRGEDEKAKAARRNAENAARNGPIQGEANEHCLNSIVVLDELIQSERMPVKMVLTIHDAIVFDLPEWMVEEVAYHAHRVMTGWPTEHVPMEVDFKVGRTLGDLKKYPFAA